MKQKVDTTFSRELRQIQTESLDFLEKFLFWTKNAIFGYFRHISRLEFQKQYDISNQLSQFYQTVKFHAKKPLNLRPGTVCLGIFGLQFHSCLQTTLSHSSERKFTSKTKNVKFGTKDALSGYFLAGI